MCTMHKPGANARGHLVPRRRNLDPLFVRYQCVFGEPNLGPLQEWQVLITAEPFLQSQGKEIYPCDQDQVL